MKQASANLRNYIAVSGILENPTLNKKIYKILWLAMLVLLVSYLVFLTIITINIVERKTLEAHALNLTNEVGALELEYLSLAKSIDVNMSKEFGFQEVKSSFAKRQSLAKAMSENNHDFDILHDISLAQNEI